MRTKQSSNPAWISKTKSWNPVREHKVFCVLPSSLFSLSKIKLFFFRILVLFSRAGRNITENSHGVKGMTFKKNVQPYLFILMPHEYFWRLYITSDSRTFLHSGCFCQNFLPQKTYQDNLNIIKLSFLLSLEENAALEIILHDKLSNKMLMFGWRKEERR